VWTPVNLSHIATHGARNILRKLGQSRVTKRARCDTPRVRVADPCAFAAKALLHWLSLSALALARCI
jgi:hypothetical protein